MAVRSRLLAPASECVAGKTPDFWYVTTNGAGGGAGSGFRVERTDTGANVALHIGSGGYNHGVYSYTMGNWIVYSDGARPYFTGGNPFSYIAGDTVTIPWGVTFAGMLTSGNADIHFLVPLDRPVTASKATITAGTAQFRQNNSYLVGGDYSHPVSLTSGLKGVQITPAGISVVLNRAWGGTNNSPVAVTVQDPMVLKFS